MKHRAGTLDGKVVGRRLANVGVHLRKPEGNQVDAVRDQSGATMNELGELGHSFDEVRRDKVTNPLRWFLTQLSLQLNLEDTVREALDVLSGKLFEGGSRCRCPYVSSCCQHADDRPSCLHVPRSTRYRAKYEHGHHRQLEGGTVVETAHDGLKLTSQHRVLHLVGKLKHRVDLLIGLLALLAKRFEGLIHGVVSLHPSVDILLLDRETGLDRLLTGPILTMRLSLDKDLLVVHTSIPTQTDSFGTFGLLETSQVELEILVVVVDRSDGGVLLCKLLLGVEDENGKMLEDDELKRDDVVWVDPVLCGLTHESGLVSTGTGVTLNWITSSADKVEELGELDDKLIVVLLVEGSGGEVVLDELLSQQSASLLIVLLDDLMETGVVELGEEGKIVDVCNDDSEALLKLKETLLVSIAVFRVGVKLVIGACIVSRIMDVAIGPLRLR